ncbi:MAG TPA: ATP-binding protein [Bryobacteraceae bacterium]|nr:ATP-binding protein [Bryobacteraceae bacterium]
MKGDILGVRRSIKRKLTAISMAASAGGLLVASVAFINNEISTYRRNMVRSLSIQAQIVAANSASALLFSDPEAARNTLSALTSAPNVTFAGIYTPAGRPFASYWPSGGGSASTLPPLPAGKTEISRFTSSELSLEREIVFHGKAIGFVYLRSNLLEIRQSLERYARIVAIVLVASLVVVFILSTVFQRAITRPLLDLAHTALAVSREKRFSLRAPPVANGDEVGMLVNTFNEMLAQIQQHEEERQKFVSLVEQTDDFIGMIGLDLRMIHINGAGRRLIGLGPHAPSDIHISEFFPENWALKLRDEVLPAIMRREGNWAGEAQIRNGNNKRPVDVSMNVFAVNHPDRDELLCFAAIIRDISERRHLEDQLRQSQKLESIGQLAGGVAHDFNNLLVVICGYSALLLEELRPGDRMRERVEEIVRAGNRAAALTRQLLVFSRREQVEQKNVAINDLVNNLQKMLRRLIGEDIEMVISLDENAGVLCADPGQIEQVIINLAVNARDAMPGGGRLLIESARLFADEEFARGHLSVAPGPWVVLSVADTGCGMSEEVKSRIFEPFYTTKEQGKGTGLGLSTVYGIVKQSGGSIWVYSESGQGTTFKILFPAVEGASPDATVSSGSGKEAGSETILLAEDEEGVRQYVSELLMRRGFQVLQAANGKDAIELAHGYSGQIHLLLTDAVMPQMSGPDLAEQFAQARPGAPVLFMSGYSDRLLQRKGMESNLIQKPFTASALITSIRSLLDHEIRKALP